MVESTSAALEQQSEAIVEAGQRSQRWKELAQKEIGQARTDLVEAGGRLTTVESAVQDLGGPR